MNHLEWNSHYPVGTIVMYRPRTGGLVQMTRTIASAYQRQPGLAASFVALGNGMVVSLEDLEAFVA